MMMMMNLEIEIYNNLEFLNMYLFFYFSKILIEQFLYLQEEADLTKAFAI